MHWLSAATILATACSHAVRAQLADLNNDTMPTSQYLTRPQSLAPALEVSLQGNFSQGYIFLSPYQAPGSGPYIYDKFGNLVWDGFGIVGAATIHNLHVCPYKGGQYLCMFAGNQQRGYAIGNAIIVDSDYRIVANVQMGGHSTPVDQHEFWLTEDGETALMTSYQTIAMDLSMEPYGVTGQQGWLQNGVFQEVNITSGEVIFEWFAADHVDKSDSRIMPHTTDVGGDGMTPHTAFDFFHINSVEKSTLTGDYLISARHTSTLYLINSTDQSIIWRLACVGTDYPALTDFQCNGFNFSNQHDARFVSENDTTTVLSLFDNASNGLNKTSPQSSGMVIALNHDSNTATLLSQSFAPDGGILSDSQGNTQLLPNGNVFHSWGSIGAVSEHTPSPDNPGQYEPVLFANVSALDAPGSIMIYRAFSFDWQSTPSNTKPSVYSYANNDTAPNAIYVSWNGATTVATWRFYAADAIGETFEVVGEKGKEGFETMWMADAHYDWVFVEAVGPDGTSLSNSSFTGSFVPSEGLVGVCDGVGCLVSQQGYVDPEG